MEKARDDGTGGCDEAEIVRDGRVVDQSVGGHIAGFEDPLLSYEHFWDIDQAPKARGYVAGRPIRLMASNTGWVTK